jgi:hypothetical protein
MATVLEECTIEEKRSVVRFLWAKGINAKDIKKFVHVCGGKCLSHKVVHNGGKYFADDEEVKTEVRKWMRQQLKASMLRVSTHW